MLRVADSARNESLVSPLDSPPPFPARSEHAASKHKQVKRGVKEVVKALRKDVKGCVPGSPPRGGFPEIGRPAAPTAARRWRDFSGARVRRLRRAFHFADPPRFSPTRSTFAAFASSRATSPRST